MALDISGDLRNVTSSSSSSSSSSAKNKDVLKKGPWTTAEDMILVEYVKRHGEGNWNAVQRNSGLMRCGKSCRLRWANHLRPNLKKGAFSIEEEKLIVDLHAKLGNKWARMAAQLPGRTDNEIKNYWNTRLKRRQRAGLPIYPQEVVQHQQLMNSSAHLLLSSQSPTPNPLPFTNPQLQLYSTTSDCTPFLNHSFSDAPMVINSCPEYKISPMKYGNLGQPSMQSPVAATPASSGEMVVAVAAASLGEDYEVELGFPRTGLLGDLFGECRTSAGGRNSAKQLIGRVGKCDVHPNDGVCSVKGTENENASGDCNKNRGKAIAKTSGETIYPMEDDLLSQLLDNFPLSVPIPEWNEGAYGSESPIMSNGTIGVMQSSPEGSMRNSEKAAGSMINNGSCLRNNMPSIY